MIPRFHLIPALLIALAAAGIVYGGLLFRAQPLERDDQLLVTPLEAVHSPADYFAAWRAGHVLDVAPLRDLSYLADLRLSAALGRPTFTFLNVALWLGFVALALSLFRALNFSDGALWVLLAVLAAHPVYAVSVAWIASRKHLLAGIFALAATLLTVKGRSRALATLLYALSLLSHPIHLLWPLWLLAWRRCFLRETNRAAAVASAPAVAVMLALGALNAWYYSGPYQLATGFGKFASESGPVIALLALGRALFNLLVPVVISPVDYQPWSWASIAGVGILPLVAWALFRRVEARRLVPWALFLVLPLALLNARSTRIFHSDTYLLLPSLGLWILLAEAARGFRPVSAFFVPVLAAGLFATHALAASFSSMSSLFALAYEREATPQVATVHAKDLFESGRLREAAEISFAAIPEFPAAELVFAQAVGVDPALSPDQKLALLRMAPGREPFLHFFLAKSLAGAGRYGEAFAEIEPLLSRLGAFGKDAPMVADEGLRWAEKAGRRTAALDSAVKAQLGGKP